MSTSENQTSKAAVVMEPTSLPTKKNRIGTLLWTIIALFVAFIAVGEYMPPHHLGAFKFLFTWFGGAFLGFVGVRIGDAVRRIARPDVLITGGRVSDVVWARICWAIGPQTVGLFLGAVSGTSILVGWVA